MGSGKCTHFPWTVAVGRGFLGYLESTDVEVSIREFLVSVPPRKTIDKVLV